MSFKKNPSHVPGTRTIPAPPQPPGRRPLRHQKHFFGPVIKDSDVTPTHHTHCLPDTLPQSDQPYTSQELPLLSSGYKTVEQPVPLEILQQAIDNQEEIPRIGFRLEGLCTSSQLNVYHFSRTYIVYNVIYDVTSFWDFTRLLWIFLNRAQGLKEPEKIMNLAGPPPRHYILYYHYKFIPVIIDIIIRQLIHSLT